MVMRDLLIKRVLAAKNICAKAEQRHERSCRCYRKQSEHEGTHGSAMLPACRTVPGRRPENRLWADVGLVILLFRGGPIQRSRFAREPTEISDCADGPEWAPAQTNAPASGDP